MWDGDKAFVSLLHVVNAVRPSLFLINFHFFSLSLVLDHLVSLSQSPSLSYLDLICGYAPLFHCIPHLRVMPPYTPALPYAALAIVPLFPSFPQSPICGRCCSISHIYPSYRLPFPCLISSCYTGTYLLLFPLVPVSLTLRAIQTLFIAHSAARALCPTVRSSPH
jgi:hypothetical protein